MKITLFTILLLFSFYELFAQNKGLSFNQLENNYIIVPDNSAINVLNNFTVEFWIKPSKTATLAQIIQEGSCANSQSSYHVFVQTDSTLNVNFNSNGSCNFTYVNNYRCDTKIIPGSCLHVAVCYSSAGVKIYFNGILQPGQYTAGGYSGNLYSTSEPLRIGTYKQINGTLNAFYDGLIDELRIWNRVLSVTEILSNFQDTLIGNETGLELYYKFDTPLIGSGMTVTNYATATGSALNGLTYSNNSTTPASNNSCFVYTGIEENTLNSKVFNIFPNPTTGRITVKGENIIIFNMLGEQIYTLFSKDEYNEIDLSIFKSGIYLVKIVSNNINYKEVLIKQ